MEISEGRALRMSKFSSHSEEVEEGEPHKLDGLVGYSMHSGLQAWGEKRGERRGDLFSR